MSAIEAYVRGSEKLTAIYGGWPTFHDAEVVELHFWRGEMKSDNWKEPALTVKIHIFIEKADSHHTLSALKFESIDDFKVEGFNHQNSLYGLSIKMDQAGSPSSRFAVQFDPALGMGASFRCASVTVLDALPCDETGKLHA